jgi:mannose-6-phosphate isomerase-like protein (cupin superfamily)
MNVELREKMRGGEGTVAIKNLFQPGDLKGKTRLLAEITVPVGASIGFHEHQNEEEIFFFITGKGKVNDNGSIREVKAGDAMVTGGGAGHSVENCGTEPLIILAAILLYD